MRNRHRSMAGLVFIVIFFCSSLAHAEGTALTGRLGTLGGGLELTRSLSETVNARVGVNFFTYEYTGEESDIEYEFDLNLFSASALLDWHPFGGVFRLSGGLVLNNNELDSTARPLEITAIGDVDYTPEEIGTLTGNIDFNNLAPYAGIGLGNAVAGDKKWGVVLDIGVMFQGTPDASLAADGLLSTDPAFLAELAKEEKDLQDELDTFKYYPVISFGITYRF